MVQFAEDRIKVRPWVCLLSLDLGCNEIREIDVPCLELLPVLQEMRLNNNLLSSLQGWLQAGTVLQHLTKLDKHRAQIFQRPAHAYAARHITFPAQPPGQQAYQYTRFCRKLLRLDEFIQAVAGGDAQYLSDPEQAGCHSHNPFTNQPRRGAFAVGRPWPQDVPHVVPGPERPGRSLPAQVAAASDAPLREYTRQTAWPGFLIGPATLKLPLLLFQVGGRRQTRKAHL